MLDLKGFEEYQQPDSLVGTRDGVYRVQKWNPKTQEDAQLLFAILHSEYGDDPGCAGVVLNQSERGPVLLVMWRSARACIREQMIRASTNLDQDVTRIERTIKDYPGQTVQIHVTPAEGKKSFFTIKCPGQKPKLPEPKAIYAEME